MSMKDKLACSLAGRRKSHAVHDVIETTLEGLHQNFGSFSGLTKRFLEVIPELPFEKPVHAADFLFLTELQTVFRDLLAARLSMRSGRIISPFDRTFLRKALRPLQKKFLAFSSAQPATGVNISCHFCSLPLSDK
jgi:hypothetical protein